MSAEPFDSDIFVGDTAGFPKISVNDVERGADGPGKVEFTVSASGFQGSKAMGAGLAELVDVAGHVGPKEALADAVKGLGAAKMCSSGAGVVGVEEQFTEGAGDSN